MNRPSSLDVKLLFDHNIAPRLAKVLQDLFPGSTHVRNVGLQEADDIVIWNFASDKDLTIVTKDDDFRQRSFLRGPPPKVIWVQLGNCTTAEIGAALIARRDDIFTFGQDPIAALRAWTSGSSRRRECGGSRSGPSRSPRRRPTARTLRAGGTPGGSPSRTNRAGCESSWSTAPCSAAASAAVVSPAGTAVTSSADAAPTPRQRVPPGGPRARAASVSGRVEAPLRGIPASIALPSSGGA